MNSCPSCKTKVSLLTKIKIWFLIPQKCSNCEKELKLNPKKSFRISMATMFLAVLFVFYLDSVGYNLVWNVLISIGSVVIFQCLLIILLVDFTDVK